MVLTKSELIASLQNEVRILLHLASKIDRAMLDYRPTPKQRSTIELLKYLSVMGPALVQAAKAGASIRPSGRRPSRPPRRGIFDQTLAAIAGARRRLCDAAGRHVRRRLPRRDRDVRQQDHARRLHRQPRALRVRGLPDAAVHVPQGLRPRGAEHDEPLGRRRCAGCRLTRI